MLPLGYALSSAVGRILGDEHGRDGCLSSSASSSFGESLASIATGHVIAMRLIPKLCEPYFGVLDSG